MKARNKILPPVHPNAGIEAEYRAKLDRLVEEMARSYYHWVRAQYRETPPEMALDATSREREMHRRTRQRESTHEARKEGEALARKKLPARELQREMSSLGKRWQARFDEVAPRLAEWFAKSTSRRSAAALQKILRDGGLTVEFKVTPAMRDAYAATVAENVGLIKSIASEYHTDVQGAVMRSVTAGRDLAGLTKELQHRHGITERRAKLIALDQNNKATSTFVRVRQADLGLMATWLHSHVGKEPRPTHLANSGKPYDPKIGWFDPDPKVRRRIWPGELIRCKCVSRSIVKGFS